MFLRRRLKICHLFFVFYLQSRFLAPFFEGEGGALPMCLIINNQPFERGCHGCDLVRVNLLVIAVMATIQQCGLVAGALGIILMLIIIARSRLFTW
jgi:hypothetical protein